MITFFPASLQRYRKTLLLCVLLGSMVALLFPASALPAAAIASDSEAKARETLDELTDLGQRQPGQRTEAEEARAYTMLQENIPGILELLSSEDDTIVRNVLRSLRNGGTFLRGSRNQVLNPFEAAVVGILDRQDVSVYTPMAAQGVLMRMETLSTDTLVKLAGIAKEPLRSDFEIYDILAKHYFDAEVAREGFDNALAGANEVARHDGVRNCL